MKNEVFIGIPSIIILFTSIFSSVCISLGQENISPLSYSLGKYVFLGALGVLLMYVFIMLLVKVVFFRNKK